MLSFVMFRHNIYFIQVLTLGNKYITSHHFTNGMSFDERDKKTYHWSVCISSNALLFFILYLKKE